jgi:hypothetical protein
VSARIVRMFELYSRKIDPDDTNFQTYLKRYLSAKDNRGPESIPYSELYKMVKEGIREYIHKSHGAKERPKK